MNGRPHAERLPLGKVGAYSASFFYCLNRGLDGVLYNRSIEGPQRVLSELPLTKPPMFGALSVVHRGFPFIPESGE